MSFFGEEGEKRRPYVAQEKKKHLRQEEEEEESYSFIASRTKTEKGK